MKNTNTKLIFVLMLIVLLSFSIVNAYPSEVVEVTSDTPFDNYISSLHNQDQNFNFYVEFNESNTNTTCYVSLDGVNSGPLVVYTVGGTVFSALETITDIPPPPEFGLEGVYTWFAHCDSWNGAVWSSSTSTSRTIIFDHTGPTIATVEPTGYVLPGIINFTFTPSDALDNGGLSCGLYVDDVLQTGAGINNGTNITLQVTINNEGDHEWYVSCSDNAVPTANVGNSSVIPFTVSSAPPTPSPEVLDILLDGPDDYYLTSELNQNINYDFYVQFNETDVTANCTQQVGSETNTVEVSTIASSYWTGLETVSGAINPIGLNDGAYLWNISCDSNLSQYTSSSRIIVFDTTGPVVVTSQANNTFGSGIRDFTFISTDQLDNSTQTCRLYIDNVQVMTGIFAENDTPTTVQYSAGADGSHDWFVSCKDTAVPTANEGNSTTRLYIVDGSVPGISLQDPEDGITVAGNTTVSFNFTVIDTSSTSFDCDLVVGSEIEDSTTATNNTPTSMSVIKTSGSYVWSINCSDNYGNQNTSESRTINFDGTGPYINITSAWEDGHTQERGANIDFNFTIEDQYSATGFSCDLIVDGNIENSRSGLNNGTLYNLSYAFIADGTYSWFINCTDPYGSVSSSQQRNVIAELAPTQPVLWELANAVSEMFFTIVGYIDRYGDIVATAQDVLYGGTNSNTTQTAGYPTETNLLGTTTVGNVYPLSTTLFAITDLDFMAQGNLTAASFIRFGGHDREYFLYYDVSSVTDYGSYYEIEISPDLEDNISIGENVYVYDRDRPTGWFNLSLELHSGLNDLEVVGSHHGIQGPEITDQIYYDNQSPVLNLTEYANVSTSNDTFTFTVDDDYELVSNTIIAQFTDSTNASINYYFVTSDTAYNTSNWELGNDTLDCLLTGNTHATCNFTVNIEDANYNLRLSANDSFNHLGSSYYTNMVVKTSVEPVPEFWHVWGSTTPNATFLVEWNASPDLYIDHYQLSVGNLPGQTNALDWFDINATPTIYLIENESILYGQIYYINIRPIDQAGNIGPYTSTELVYTMDPSPPVMNELLIVPDSVFGNWINDPSRLDLFWNFTDNQTGVVSYQYGVGTTTYDEYSGWQDTIAQTASASENGVYITNISLVEGEEYYLNARAKNGYPYSTIWSSWFSSPAATLDSKAPINASISYPLGDLATNDIVITYGVGNDSGINGAYPVSGLDYAKLLFKQANFLNGQCELFGDWVEVNASLHLANPETYDYTVQSGKCYQFGIKVYDQAGNYNITTYSVGNNVSVDFTPPSTVNISGTPVIVAENTLSFSWTESTDPESGLDRYKCGLGTTPGATDTTGAWLDCGTSTHVTLYNLTLADAEIYYFSVQPVNNHGVEGNISTSYGLLYFDMYPPQALTVNSVGGDFEDSDGWMDATSGNFTTIRLEGEDDLTCVWSYFDVAYADQGAGYVQGCTITTPGNYQCNITNLVEDWYDVHVACKDATGNAQTEDGNTDIHFGKELVGPRINITHPMIDGMMISELNPTFTTDIVDVNNLTQAHYILYDADTQIVLTSGNLTENYTATINLTNYPGENTFNVTATDLYNHTTTTGRTFFANDGAPHMDLSYTQTASQLFTSTVYLNTNLTINVAAYFVNNVTYQILNSTGDLISNYNYSWTNLTGITQKHEFSINVNEADFANDGNYTLVLFGEGNESFSDFQENRTIIFDKVNPKFNLSTLEITPSTVYENLTNVNYYLVIEEDNLDYITFNYTVDSSSYEINATKTNPRPWHPQEIRYLATIPSYNLLANASVNTFWKLYDLAGNSNITSTNLIFVENREPNITSTEIETALEGTSYISQIAFTDEDASQEEFNCELNYSISGLTINQTPTKKICELRWISPVSGNYSFNVTVHDKKDGVELSSDSQIINLTVYSQADYTIFLNANSFSFDVSIQTPANYDIPVFNTGTGTVVRSIPESTLQNVSFSRPEYRVDAYNVEQRFPLNFYFRKNLGNIQNTTYDIGNTDADRYKPVLAHATSISQDSNFGEIVWLAPAPNGVYSSPVYDAGVIYYGDDNGTLHARNANTGALIWNHMSPGETIPSTPLVDNNKIYFTDDDTLFSYYLNGTQDWSLSVTGVQEKLAIDSETLVLADTSGTVRAVNVSENGSLLWTYSANGYIQSSAVISNGKVFVGSWNDSLHVINLTDGTPLWNYATQNNVDSTALIYNDIVYFGSNDQHLYALNISNNGTQLWNYTLTSQMRSTPIIYSGILYFGDYDGIIRAVNPETGLLYWSKTLDGTIRGKPSIDQDVLYVGTLGGTVYALNLSSAGTQIWNYTLGESEIYEDVIVNSGLIYLGTENTSNSSLSRLFTLRKQEPATHNYKITFNYEEAGINESDVNKLDILKYPYDEDNEEILFHQAGSGDGVLTSTLDTNAKTISATVNTFSVFILALDDPSATCNDGIRNQGEEQTDCGGPCSVCPTSSGSSSSSSGGSGGFSAPPETCDDGIQNQNEVEIDCGGVCDVCVGIATCTDGLRNQDETGVDCGGSCPTCAPVATCSDNIQNQGEFGVDCGGPCRSCTPVATCNDGIKNQNEVGVDCGGSCRSCQTTNQELSKEEPRPLSKSTTSPLLWVLIGVVVVGGIIVVAIEAPRKGQVDETLYKKLTIFPTDNNIVSIARYIKTQTAEGHDLDLIKEHLVTHDYTEIYIDSAIHALEKEEEIEKIVQYFEEYTRQGYSLQEMTVWLDQKGVDDDLLAIAIDHFKNP